MGNFKLREFIFGAIICIAALFAVPMVQAQTELSRFLDAVDEARVQDKVLFVYFHTLDLDHPLSFQDVLPEEVAESMIDRASHVDIDTAAESGRALADAFFDVGKLSPKDQMRPILGIVPPDRKRAITILDEGVGKIEPASWSRLWAQAASSD